MDPYTLAYLAGHSDFSTTKRYVHPQEETVLAAMDRAREAQGSHSFSHSGEKSSPKVSGEADEKSFGLKAMKWSGREDSNLRPPGPEPDDDFYSALYCEQMTALKRQCFLRICESRAKAAGRGKE